MSDVNFDEDASSSAEPTTSTRYASRDPRDQTRVEDEVGNPTDRLLALKDRIQKERVRTFSTVESDFLALLWCIDTYRSARVIPRTPLLNRSRSKDESGEGLYRSKGNWFSEVIALILGNKTTSTLAPRARVKGFSQEHQIDIAWPARDARLLRSPVICCEAKLTGAPGVQGGKPRGGLADWSNRRKEIKFQAADLKLAGNRESTSIHNWNAWRKRAEPRVFIVWAARLEDPKQLGGEQAQFKRMIREAQNLTATYSDGVGIYAFKPTPTGYEPLSAPFDAASRVTTLDEMLNEIAGEIKDHMEYARSLETTTGELIHE